MEIQNLGSADPKLTCHRIQSKDQPTRSSRAPKNPTPPPEAQEAPSASTTFPLFPKLPPELRMKIWRYAVNEPRIVEVHVAELYAWISRGDERPHREIIKHYRSKTDDPPLLRTCRESWAVASLNGYKRTDLASQYCADSVYFEYEVDTMYITGVLTDAGLYSWDPLDPYGIDLASSVRSIAFDATPLCRRAHGWSMPELPLYHIATDLMKFENVESVTLVFNEGHRGTADEKLSAIRLYDLQADTDVGSLQYLADRFSPQLKQERTVGYQLRNPAWVEPPVLPMRMNPLVKIKFTRLLPSFL